MDRVINILFTGVGRRVELLQAFRNAALVLHKNVKIYGADYAGTAPALAYCDGTRTVAAMKDPRYIDDLLAICRADSIDLVIPTIDTDLLVLSENRERFDEIGTKVMISAPEAIRICRDKFKTAQFFQSLGLHTPVPVSDWIEYRGSFPAFIKPRDGSSSINAFMVHTEEELKAFAEMIGNYMVQPFVEGKEYTIDMFCDWNGEPISIVPRERIQVRAGEVLKTRIAMNPAIMEESRILIRALKPCGPLTVQLIREKDTGRDWFIEINPRYGGGAPLSMKAGARTAESILRILDHERPDEWTDIADGAVYSRFDQSVCITEGRNTVNGVIFDLDDTLFSEKDYVRSGFKAVSAFLGGEYEDRLWELFSQGKAAIDELLKELGREADKAEAVRAYREHFPEIRLYEGAEELIRRLKKEGKKVGIITDGRPEGQRNKIEALGLAELIDDILITDELGGPQFRKPCDIAFRILQNRWELPAGEILFVGDNPAKDFQAPRQLGMKALWFRNPDGLYAEGADCPVEHFDRFEELGSYV